MGQSKTKQRTASEGDATQRTNLARQTAIGDRYRLAGSYERLRRVLLEAPEDGRLDQTLSYWVLPTDRRLPIALLDQTVRELITMPIEKLMQTPGIGQKKIIGLFDLLSRASKYEALHEPFGLSLASAGDQKRDATILSLDKAHSQGTPHRRGKFAKGTNANEVGNLPFDPGQVSEEVWSSWCETVDRAGLAQQKLGRVAPTLRPLPTVIWQKELSEYSRKSLAEIRQLKTHGSKRVNAILEVFHAIHEAVSTSVMQECLEILIVPRFVPRVTNWLIEANANPTSISVSTFREKLARPLVDQIGLDLGEPLANLVEKRLLVDGEPETIKQQAEKLQLTRARIYQLLDDCAQVMQVRWPEGRWLLAPLGSLESPRFVESDPTLAGLMHATHNLFFPQDTVSETASVFEKA